MILFCFAKLSFFGMRILFETMLHLDVPFGTIGLQGCLFLYRLLRSIFVFQSVAIFFIPSFCDRDSGKGGSICMYV